MTEEGNLKRFDFFSLLLLDTLHIFGFVMIDVIPGVRVTSSFLKMFSFTVFIKG